MHRSTFKKCQPPVVDGVYVSAHVEPMFLDDFKIPIARSINEFSGKLAHYTPTRTPTLRADDLVRRVTRLESSCARASHTQTALVAARPALKCGPFTARNEGQPSCEALSSLVPGDQS